jgi:hypothetical protein
MILYEPKYIRNITERKRMKDYWNQSDYLVSNFTHKWNTVFGKLKNFEQKKWSWLISGHYPVTRLQV